MPITNYFNNHSPTHISTHIRVENDLGHFLFEYDGKKSDGNYFGYSRHCGLLESIVFPVRTDNIADLARDLMPLINRSNTIGLKAIALIGDCITLPIRLITLIPRVAFNAFYKLPLARLDALSFKPLLHIPTPYWNPFYYFWTNEQWEAYVQEIIDTDGEECVERLQKELATGYVNVIVTTKEELRHPKVDITDRVVTTTHFRAYTKPTLESQKVEQSVTHSHPLFNIQVPVN